MRETSGRYLGPGGKTSQTTVVYREFTRAPNLHQWFNRTRIYSFLLRDGPTLGRRDLDGLISGHTIGRLSTEDLPDDRTPLLPHHSPENHTHLRTGVKIGDTLPRPTPNPVVPDLSFLPLPWSRRESKTE